LRNRSKRNGGGSGAGGGGNGRSNGHEQNYDEGASGSNDIDSGHDIDKYEKVSLIKDIKKQKAFVYADLSKLKIYTLIVIFLSALNTLFSVLFMQAYKLQNITSLFYTFSMLGLLLTAIFGQISIIRVEQKHEKHYFSNMSGTFSFEALMVYFRLVIIAIPLTLYHTA